MVSFARVLMGLSFPVQFVGDARELDSSRWPWPKAPQIARRWFAAISAESEESLAWRVETLKETLNGIDLHCVDAVDPPQLERLARVHKDYVVDEEGEYSASLVLSQWPREVSPGWLGRALSGETPLSVAIHFRPKDPAGFARYLKKQQRNQADELAAGGDAAAELAHADAAGTRKKIVAGTDRPCSVAIVFTVYARSVDQLRSRTETVGYDIGLALAMARPIRREHDRGRVATSPLGECPVVGAWKTLDCTSVATTGIFQPPTILHKDGVDVGTTHAIGTFRKGSQLVRLDVFDPSLEGFSMVVVGKKRMGKSYFIKVLARGTARRGVEVTIIEQRRPAEYAVLLSEPNITVVNVEEVAGDLDEPEVAARKRTEFLRRFTTEYWNECRRNPRPRMLIVDEGWFLLRNAQSADWIEEVARTGGHFGLSFVMASQQVREFLKTGEAVIDNAEMVVAFKQIDNDLEDSRESIGLARAVGMPAPARTWLSSAGRGQMLLRVGDLWLAVDVARVPEHYEITTDPRDVWARLVDNGENASDDEEGDTRDDSDAPGEDRSPDRRLGHARVGSGLSGRSNPLAASAVRL